MALEEIKMSDVKYPNITVQLIGQDGNSFFILGKVQKAMYQAKLTKEQVQEYMDKATSGDYDKLLATTMEYVDVS